MSMTRDELVQHLTAEACQPIPEPPTPMPDDSPATCARRRAELKAALTGFIYTPAAKRQQVKLRKHFRSQGDAA